MVRALLISATVGGVCGLLSCYMTLKGWALMGDAVSHSVLPGVILAYAIGLPFSVGAFVFGVCRARFCLDLVGLVRRRDCLRNTFLADHSSLSSKQWIG